MPGGMSAKRKLAAAGIVLGSLIVVSLALWAGETFARQQITAQVTSNVRQALSLDAKKPVTVKIAGFSVLAQAVTGKLEQVDVSVDDVTLGELTGDVAVRAKGIPVDRSKPVDRVGITFSATEKSVQSIAQDLSEASIETVEFAEPDVRLGSKFSVFGFSVDVILEVEPFADKGEIAFTPKAIEVGGVRTSAEDLTRVFGSLATNLLRTQKICVARWLPAVVHVEDVTVHGDTLAVTIGASKVVLDQSAMSEPGTCPRAR